MWDINNCTPYKVGAAILRDKRGAETLIVAVRATFEIGVGGSTSPAEEQLDPVLAPKFLADPTQSSLIYDTDFVLAKPATDVVLQGHAYRGGAGKSGEAWTEVTMSVDGLRKTLLVTGDRFWEKGLLGLRVTRPEPFEKIPIIYERAFGGKDERSKRPAWDTRNPLGTGFAAKKRNLIGQRLPNITYPSRRSVPAGFGPIPRHWAPRVSLAGTYDEQWQKNRAPLLPDDCHDRFFQSAPADQQPAIHLRGGEPVELVNLGRPGVIRFDLPRIRLVLATNVGGKIHEHRAKLHTVALEPDVLRFSLTWHSSLQCHNRTYKIRRINVREKVYLESGLDLE